MHEQISPLTLELLHEIHRALSRYIAHTRRMPAAICFSACDPLGSLHHVYGIQCITDLKLEPGAVDIIDEEGWAVCRLWTDGTTRP